MIPPAAPGLATVVDMDRVQVVGCAVRVEVANGRPSSSALRRCMSARVGTYGRTTRVLAFRSII